MRTWRWLALVVAMLGILPAAHAEDCWISAANRQQLDPYLLYAIAYVESGYNQKAINRNTNGTLDMGMMQINTFWLPTLRKHGISERELKHPCTNIEVGAWVLRQNFNQYGFSWKAIGAYNARTPSKQLVYARKVYAVYDKLKAAYGDSLLVSRAN